MNKKRKVLSTTAHTQLPAVKTDAELELFRTSAAAVGVSGTTVACWFKDTGGADQCIPMDSTDCTDAGGVPRPGACPN